MATDVGEILANLNAFYDFEDKSVIHAGAGGGTLIGYAAKAREVLAVDPDHAAVEELRESVRKEGLAGRFQVVQGVLESVSATADVVFLEFCLHEMEDPGVVLVHAHSLAPEVLVIDHLPHSPWSWYTCETEKLERSWSAIQDLAVLRRASFVATQRFKDHAELLARLQVLGEPVLSRIEKFAGRRDIEIEMPYGMALLTSRRV